MNKLKLRTHIPIIFPSWLTVGLFLIFTIVGFIYNTTILILFFNSLATLFSTIANTLIVAQIFATTILIIICLLILLLAKKLYLITPVILGLVVGCIISITYSSLVRYVGQVFLFTFLTPLYKKYCKIAYYKKGRKQVAKLCKKIKKRIRKIDKRLRDPLTKKGKRIWISLKKKYQELSKKVCR